MKAYQLIADPEHWIRFHNAADKEGMFARADSEEACRWCAHGAIIKCYGKSWLEVAHRFEDFLHKHYNATSIGSFNDKNPHKKVVRALKEADI